MTKGTENIIQTDAGQRGSIFVNDTQEYNASDYDYGDQRDLGNFSYIHTLSDVKFYTLDDSRRSNLSNDITNVNVTIPSGVVMGGNFTKIQLRSGSVIIYV